MKPNHPKSYMGELDLSFNQSTFEFKPQYYQLET